VTNGGGVTGVQRVSGNVGLILIQARATAFSSCAQCQLPRTEHLSMKGRLELITPGTPTHVFQDRLGDRSTRSLLISLSSTIYEYMPMGKQGYLRESAPKFFKIDHALPCPHSRIRQKPTLTLYQHFHFSHK